jgi:hypothetical protein
MSKRVVDQERTALTIRDIINRNTILWEYRRFWGQRI